MGDLPTTLTADLARLIGYDTVSSRPNQALAADLAARAEGLGMRVELFEDPDEAGKRTVIAWAGPEPEGDGRGLTITGHLDVVPVEGQPWSSDPFVLREADGLLYGRGTADMKGFVAVTMRALEGVDLDALREPLALVWTHDEEVGCFGSAKLVAAWAEAGRGLPSACLVGEPTGFEMLRMHPGHVAGRVTVHGAAAHSSRPDLGVNAIEGAAEVVRCAQTLAEALRAEPVNLPEMERPWVAVNVARIHGGTAINIVPDRCTVDIGYRPLPGAEPEAVWFRLVEMLAARPHLQVETELLRITPSMLTPADAPIVGELLPFAKHPHCGAAGFATDGANLAKLGCAPIVFGPGSIDVAHQADEHVPLADLVRAVEVVQTLVRRRCQPD
ncbi:MAG: acetylornithine deacetylase [Myxococcota bacterium]